MYGPDAVGEQELSEQLIESLPPGSALIADRNFGVFSVVWHARGKGHQVLVRLMRDRAAQLSPDSAAGFDRPVIGRASAADHRAHRQLPPDASVQGRLVVIQPERGRRERTAVPVHDPARTGG
jgi:hypothetical protein